MANTFTTYRNPNTNVSLITKRGVELISYWHILQFSALEWDINFQPDAEKITQMMMHYQQNAPDHTPEAKEMILEILHGKAVYIDDFLATHLTDWLPDIQSAENYLRRFYGGPTEKIKRQWLGRSPSDPIGELVIATGGPDGAHEHIAPLAAPISAKMILSARSPIHDLVEVEVRKGFARKHDA